jgi:uncharacterized membrane protein
MVRDVLLAAHIAAGSVGLLMLPVIIVRPKGTAAHRRLGRGFLWCLRIVTISAVGLAVIDFAQLWWFVLIAAFSLALGEVGSRAWRQRFDVAVQRHLAGMGGAGIAFVTAVLVVNFGTLNPVAWVLPTVVGSPIIALTTRRVLRRGVVASRQASIPAQQGRMETSATL